MSIVQSREHPAAHLWQNLWLQCYYNCGFCPPNSQTAHMSACRCPLINHATFSNYHLPHSKPYAIFPMLIVRKQRMVHIEFCQTLVLFMPSAWPADEQVNKTNWVAWPHEQASHQIVGKLPIITVCALLPMERTWHARFEYLCFVRYSNFKELTLIAKLKVERHH